MVAEGSSEPSKRGKAKNNQSGRCEAEERMGGDSSEDILRRGEACTLRLRAAVVESEGIGDSGGGYAEYLVENDVVVGRRGTHLRTFCVEEKRGHFWLRAAVVEPGGERRQRRGTC
jgi:hypothetical protein